MGGHIDLMHQFLSMNDVVTRERLDLNGIPARSAPQAADRRRVTVFDLARAFDLPFAFSGYLMRGAPTFEAMIPYLTEGEREEAERLAARFGHGQRWTEWGLSRLAVKRAAADLLAGKSSARPAEARIEIRKRDGGAPYIALPDPEAWSPAISIAHASAAGLGVACEPGWRLGIDFDAPRRVRDAADFLDTILSDSEKRSLRVPADRSASAALWCIKEAAAKALGSGLTGQPRSYTVSAYDHRTGAATVQHNGATLEAAVRRLGEGICAVAYLPTPGG